MILKTVYLGVEMDPEISNTYLSFQNTLQESAAAAILQDTYHTVY